MELLVERGGDLTVGERTPLYEATQEGHVDVVHFIVQKLRETVEPPTVLKDLNSSLVCAAEGNNVIICNILLENGAQVVSTHRSKSWRTMSVFRTPCRKTAEQLSWRLPRKATWT